MEKPLVLKNSEIKNVLSDAAAKNLAATLSYLSRGKWHMAHIRLLAAGPKTVQIELDQAQNTSVVRLQPEQPVGISFRADANKYIFESVIKGFDAAGAGPNNGKILLSMPSRMDQMPRRTFSRAAVPDALNVRVIFWHRGYINDTDKKPAENCWEGRLVDLSAGGLQVALEPKMAQEFSAGQLLGMQFTPMAYEKPICVEGQVKHLAEVPEKNLVYLGIEFIGLEASYEGRDKLQRIVQTVDTYHEDGNSPLQEPLFGVSEISS